DGSEITARVGPFIPDADAVLVQVGDIGVAAQEPEQLVHDRLDVQLLGGQQREALRQIHAYLTAEHRACTRAGAIVLAGAVRQHIAEKVEVDLHGEMAKLDRRKDNSLDTDPLLLSEDIPPRLRRDPLPAKGGEACLSSPLHWITSPRLR